MGTEAVTVTTTIDDRDKAEALARLAVSERLAACAQVSGPVTSVYWWRGEVEDAAEFTVTFKTTVALAEALVTRLKAEHSYDVPEILVTAVLGGNPDYLEWVAAETTSPPA
jgi:periplasmic divalent cation tolerance protein